MLDVRVEEDTVRIGQHFQMSFQRTLRIPDDDSIYPLPPGLGEFPIFRIEDFEDRVPTQWKKHGGVFISMYQREALWLNFDGAYWRPNVVKVAVGKIDAISGKRLHRRLNRTRQNYLICPDQPWLDGINAGDGYIRQFVAMPLGMGYTVEGQLTGKEEFGGLQVVVYDPLPGKFPDQPPARPDFADDEMEVSYMMAEPSAPPEMGLAAGGRMRQEIYPDEYGVDTWDPENYGRVYVHIVNSMMFREITGMEPPPTPVSARMYTEHGFPWFELYDEGKGDVDPSKTLAGVKSVKQMDKKKGFGNQQDDNPVKITDGQVKKIKPGEQEIKDGEW
jgi:hypothetical protein